MPTYQYQCTECGEGLEAVQKFTDDALTECPSCERTPARRCSRRSASSSRAPASTATTAAAPRRAARRAVEAGGVRLGHEVEFVLGLQVVRVVVLHVDVLEPPLRARLRARPASCFRRLGPLRPRRTQFLRNPVVLRRRGLRRFRADTVPVMANTVQARRTRRTHSGRDRRHRRLRLLLVPRRRDRDPGRHPVRAAQRLPLPRRGRRPHGSPSCPGTAAATICRRTASTTGPTSGRCAPSASRQVLGPCAVGGLRARVRAGHAAGAGPARGPHEVAGADVLRRASRCRTARCRTWCTCPWPTRTARPGARAALKAARGRGLGAGGRRHARRRRGAALLDPRRIAAGTRRRAGRWSA